MGRGFTSSDVAVWLRFQIAAGRLAEDWRSDQLESLSRRLGVSMETLSDAISLIASKRDGECPKAECTDPDGYRIVADLIEEIAATEQSFG